MLSCGALSVPGTRKEVRVGGVGVLLFWYRSQIYAIESRCASSDKQRCHETRPGC